MTLEQAQTRLVSLQAQGVVEVLVLSGEVHPLHPRRSHWFQHIVDLCQLSLSLGFLPHTNVGPLSKAEMATLKTVNVSMGLMLEQITPALLQTVHRHAPSKEPDLRLQQLAWAGELRIPFTTGLLLGIGETQADRIETLEAIAAIHQQWGHIQEVILQPHSPGQQQTWQGEEFPGQQLVELVAIARQRLPDSITLQIPPNLISPSVLLDCIAAGARDLGGISPKDEVNPDYPHPHDQALASLLNAAGWQLLPRLPIYPQYDRWVVPQLQPGIEHWRQRLAQLQPPLQYPDAVKSSG
jgi:7,8-didemethyl-8-hydroxy-5-deazariboflavin synthase